MSAHNGLSPDPAATVSAETTPDREAVARISHNLASMKANPASEEIQASIRKDLQAFGRGAFFHAALENLPAAQEQKTPSVQPLGVAGAAVGKPLQAAQGQTRQTWQDWVGARQDQPLRIYSPTTLADLVSVLRQAEQNNCRVKAVGSGHSFSDVAGTRDFLVETHGLNRPIPLDPTLLRPNADPSTLFETEAGIVIRDLNEILWANRRGLVNLGGYDGQTIAGVISTSTHGSGISFGPLPEQVVSLTLVAAGGRVVRVEPAGGITDPQKWANLHPSIELKQDDEWFHACQVSLGCLGIVYSVVLRVQTNYYLKEDRTLSTWSRVRQDIQNSQVIKDNAHYEVLVNPYATQPGGEHTCLVTRRNPVPPPAQDPSDLPMRSILVELAAGFPGSSSALLAVLDAFPSFTPNIVDDALQSIAGVYIDRSYRVYNVGSANDVPAYASEIGFPIDRALDAVDRILAIAAKRQSLGQVYLNSPFSLRFVKASEAHLSMMQGADTCMVELISLIHTVGGMEILQEIETEMYAFGGRPHWGLMNFLSGAGRLIETMYPLLPRWQKVREALDPNGRFANAFTERCGLTPLTFTRG